jgi:hypothetical protein
MNRAGKLRNLVLVLGDQLDEKSSAFDDFDLKTDAGWMAEVAHESEKVWVAKPRIAIFSRGDAALPRCAAGTRLAGFLPSAHGEVRGVERADWQGSDR